MATQAGAKTKKTALEENKGVNEEEDSRVQAKLAEGVESKLKEELTCSICLDICIRPCTTPCGHNFCRRCLRGKMMYSFKCPKCRKKLPSKFELTVNTVLWNTIQMLFPQVANAPSSPTIAEPDPLQQTNSNRYYISGRDGAEFMTAAQIQSLLRTMENRNGDIVANTSLETLMLRLDLGQNSSDMWQTMHESTQDRTPSTSHNQNNHPLRVRINQRGSPRRELSPLQTYRLYPRQHHSSSPQSLASRSNFQNRIGNSLRSHPTGSARSNSESRTPVLATAHAGPRSHPVPSSRRQRALGVFSSSNLPGDGSGGRSRYEEFSDYFYRPFDMHPVEQSSHWNIGSDEPPTRQQQSTRMTTGRRIRVGGGAAYLSSNSHQQDSADLRSHSLEIMPDLDEEDWLQIVEDYFEADNTRQEEALEISRLNALRSQGYRRDISSHAVLRSNLEGLNDYRQIDEMGMGSGSSGTHHNSSYQRQRHISSDHFYTLPRADATSMRPSAITSRMINHDLSNHMTMAGNEGSRRSNWQQRQAIYSQLSATQSRGDMDREVGRRDIDFSRDYMHIQRRHEPSPNEDPGYSSPMSFCSDEAESGSSSNMNEDSRVVYQRRSSELRRAPLTTNRGGEREGTAQINDEQRMAYNQFCNISSMLEEAVSNLERYSDVPHIQSQPVLPLTSSSTSNLHIQTSANIIPISDDDSTEDWDNNITRSLRGGVGIEEFVTDTDDSFSALAFSDEEDDSDVVMSFAFPHRRRQQAQGFWQR